MEEKTANNLKSSEAKMSQFKMFPKIHKKGNPGRPVVTSVDCHTTKISKYVDHLLQPHVKELRSYVKISRDFMRKINNLERISENRIFVTMDVRSLYTKIPNNECIKAVKDNLKAKNHFNKNFTTFLHLVLTVNNFMFNCQNYLQIKGCAIGTKLLQVTRIYSWVHWRKIYISSRK